MVCTRAPHVVPVQHDLSKALLGTSADLTSVPGGLVYKPSSSSCLASSYTLILVVDEGNVIADASRAGAMPKLSAEQANQMGLNADERTSLFLLYDLHSAADSISLQMLNSKRSK